MTRKLANASKRDGVEQIARAISIGGLALTIVVALLRPADSVEVERGAALLFVPMVLGTWLASIFSLPRVSWFGACRTERWFNGLLVALLIWMLLATVSVVGEGNVRQAINEWWWWVSGVFLLLAARNCLVRSDAVRSIIVLLLALMAGTCAFAAHQQIISLPGDRALYEADPEGVLKAAGIDAPQGSPKRLLFEARLYGGGVTGTFALANSYAGLLVLCLPLAMGECLASFKGKYWVQAVIWILVSAAAIVVLVWTDSRSAYLSLMVGTLLALVWQMSHGVKSEEHRSIGLSKLVSRYGRSLWLLMFASAGLVVFLFALGRGLWGFVPRSLAFRFQYWNATVRMLGDRPWFGAGPGNFQQRYGTYRLEEASEGIADPHNWLMEILGAGGIPGLILCGAIGLTAVLALRRAGGENDKDDETGYRDSKLLVWIVGGAAFVGFLGVVGDWIATFSLPDFDALLAMFCVTVGCYCTIVSRGREIWKIAGLTALGIHLLASGGLTVPGVSIPAIVIAGAVLHRKQEYAERPIDQNGLLTRIRLSALAVSLAMLAAWQWSAWGPTSAAAKMTNDARDAVAAGFVERGIDLYQEAADADVYDPLPLVGKSETLVWQAVSSRSDTSAAGLRKQLDQAISEAILREPGSPHWQELLGRQRVILFQRFGDRNDLEVARDAYVKAVALSPGEVGWAAQLAIIQAQLGEMKQATRFAERAVRLSEAGGHTDRSLDVVSVLAVRQVGEGIMRGGPEMISARDALVQVESQVQSLNGQ